jgi:hypothetical protein
MATVEDNAIRNINKFAESDDDMGQVSRVRGQLSKRSKYADTGGNYSGRAMENINEFAEHGEPRSTKKSKEPSIFQRIAQVAAPGMAGESKAFGKKGAASVLRGFAGGAIANTGKRVGSLIGKGQAVPVWLQDRSISKKGKRKMTQIDGMDLPPWIHGGGMPWDAPKQKDDVERIVITRIHADGSRTTSTRHPNKKKRSGDRPSWIQF